MPGTTESQNASTSEDISVCCSSWTVRSDHNKNSGTSIINHHLHVHIDRNSWILINLHRKSKMNLQEVTPFTESWNVFNLVTRFERHDKKTLLTGMHAMWGYCEIDKASNFNVDLQCAIWNNMAYAVREFHQNWSQKDMREIHFPHTHSQSQNQLHSFLSKNDSSCGMSMHKLIS